MSSQQSFVEAILGIPFGTRAFARGICRDVFVNLFAESNDAPVIVGAEKLSGAGVTVSSALRKTFHGHALPSTSVVDLVVIGSLKAHKEASSLPFPHPFQSGLISKIPSALENMRPSGYYGWDTGR